MLTRIASLGLFLMLGACGSYDISHVALRPRQMEIVLDLSRSMWEPAPGQPLLSRFAMVQHVAPAVINDLAADGVWLGLVSVGGLCGAPPAIDLPVGSAPTLIRATIAAATPIAQSWTDLNHVLRMIPGRFHPSVPGPKRALLLTDGQNTCPPVAPTTCEIAKQLYEQHGITIDVAALVIDPQVEAELRCVAKVSHGTFMVPRTVDEWHQLTQLLRWNPWPYVVLLGGMSPLLLASRVLYRQGFHAWGWETRRATSRAALLLSSGTLALYLTLFAETAWAGGLIGLVVLVGLFWALAKDHGGGQNMRPRPTHTPPWIIGLLLSAVLVGASGEIAQGSEAPACRPMAAPSRHWIIALDMSGSVQQHFAAMKRLVGRVIQLCIRPGDEITLATFAQDITGQVQEQITFLVPEDGSTAAVHHVLNDLAIQKPRETRTLFRPVVEFLNLRLMGVWKEPVVLTVSDFKSDAPAQDDSFWSTPVRGVYNVKGVQGWMVVIHGGTGLDFTPVFTDKPIPVPSAPGPSKRPGSEGIDACLLAPEVAFESATREVLLWPSWIPWRPQAEGTLTLRIWHQCAVTRERAFEVHLRFGDEIIPVAHMGKMYISREPTTLPLPVRLPTRHEYQHSGKVDLLLEQGNMKRPMSSYNPTVVTFLHVPYWSAYGSYLGLVGGVVLLGIGITVLIRRRHRVLKREQPEYVQIPGGATVPLFCGHTALLGGEECALAVPGLPSAVELALVTWEGKLGELLLRAQNGVRMKLNGEEVSGSVPYRFGQWLQFHAVQGHVCNLTLHQGKQQAISLTSVPIGGGGPSLIDHGVAETDLFDDTYPHDANASGKLSI